MLSLCCETLNISSDVSLGEVCGDSRRAVSIKRCFSSDVPTSLKKEGNERSGREGSRAPWPHRLW